MAHDNDNDRYEPNSDFCGPGDAKVVLHKKKTRKRSEKARLHKAKILNFNSVDLVVNSSST